MRVTLITFSLAILSAAGRAQVPVSFSPPAHALHDSIAAAELRFFFEWGRVWRLGMPYSATVDSTRPRNQHLHCHPGMQLTRANTNPSAVSNWSVRQGSMIRSRAGAFAVCPTWIFEKIPGDERHAIDAGLLQPFREPVNIARRSLLGLIEAATGKEPHDPFFVGQQIRFLLDLELPDSALRVAKRCRSNAWWCAALTGYVLTEMHQTVRAESAFVAALDALSPLERCRWTNFGFLLDSLGRGEYAKLNCDLRASVNTRLWWLADPLFIVPGNERRIEQFARSVQTTLRRMLDRDERYEWRLIAGGDAMEELVTRFGWPSYTWWGGEQNDRNHSSFLKGFSSPMFPGPLHEPYTTFEYTLGRQHLVPLWRALLDPLTAKSADWQINAPDSGFTAAQNELLWWPNEHFEGAYPLLQLVDGQVAMLRRDSSIILATAHDLMRSRLPRALGTEIDATLLVTDRPDSYRVVSVFNERADHRLVMYGHVEPRPILVGIEIPPRRPTRNYGARARFSITPPATLAAMSPGQLDISEPVILVAPAGDDPSPVELDPALRAMAASVRTPPTRRIAVYWETYGFSPTDTVDVAVWIERYTSQGFLRKFGNAMRVTTDLNTPVAITWREPQPGSRMQVVRGRVPVISRSVVLDTSTLPRGSYWLDVAVAKPGQPPVRSRRGIVIE
jgi:hypothetical protein